MLKRNLPPTHPGEILKEMFIIKYLSDYYTNKTKLNNYLPVMKNFLCRVYK